MNRHGRRGALNSTMIKPGHALELTTVWSGKVNQHGVKKITAGTYTITVAEDGFIASTAVKIVQRRKIHSSARKLDRA